MHGVTYVMIIRGHNPRIHELQHLYSFIQQPPVVKWGSGQSLTMQTSAVWHWQKLCLLQKKTPVHVFEQKGNLLTLFCDVHIYVSPSLYLKSCYGLSECAYKNLTVNVALVTTQKKKQNRSSPLSSACSPTLWRSFSGLGLVHLQHRKSTVKHRTRKTRKS